MRITWREAFKPLGVYINFFQPTLKAGEQRAFKVMMVNDYAQAVTGKLVLSLEDANGATLVQAEQRFEMPSVGDTSVELSLTIPAVTGKCTLKAVAAPDGEPKTRADCLPAMGHRGIKCRQPAEREFLNARVTV